MGRAFIVEGDKTSHGGTVLEGSAFSTTNGRRIARMGDKVYCPHCRRTTSIIEGDHTMIVDGAPVALDGHKTSCGAVLIASQQPTYKDMGSANTGSHNSGDDAFASLFSPYVAEEDNIRMKFNDRHRFVDDTGQPIANTPYRVTRGNDAIEDGTTDENGYAHLLSSIINPELVKFHTGESND